MRSKHARQRPSTFRMHNRYWFDVAWPGAFIRGKGECKRGTKYCISNSLAIQISLLKNVPSTSSNVSVRSSIRGNISSYFNPRQNYGQHQPQRRHQAARQNPVQATKCSRTQSRETNMKYIKDMFLLPSPLWITIPRRDKKAFLQTNNLVIDTFIIDKRWNLSELKSQFCQLFMSNEMKTLEDIGFV